MSRPPPVPGAPSPSPGPSRDVPVPGGALRLVAPDRVVDPVPWGLHGSADLLFSAAVFPGLARQEGDRPEPSLARAWERQARPDPVEGARETWTFRLDGTARFASGEPVAAVDVVRSWERLLRSPLSSYRFLLDPVVGAASFRDGEAEAIAGLRATDGELRVSFLGPTPDWLARLAHPALGVWRGDPPEGAGPFAADAQGPGVEAHRLHTPAPVLDRVALVERASAGAALLLAAREVDAVAAFGREAGEIARDPGAASLRRLPAWDRTYAVALSPGAGPIAGDASLRGALLAAIERDRAGLVALLFDGRGEPVASLLPGGALPGPVEGGAPSIRPGSVSLSYDRDDPQAATVASRVKAAWDQAGVRTRLDGASTLDHAERLLAGAFDAALVLHRPPTSDPVLALRGSLPPALTSLPDVAASLAAAERIEEPAARLAAARHAESLLIRRSLLLPIARLHAWLAADPRLWLAEDGRLVLESSGWLP